jgi:hypothetical protein
MLTNIIGVLYFFLPVFCLFTILSKYKWLDLIKLSSAFVLIYICFSVFFYRILIYPLLFAQTNVAPFLEINYHYSPVWVKISAIVEISVPFLFFITPVFFAVVVYKFNIIKFISWTTKSLSKKEFLSVFIAGQALTVCIYLILFKFSVGPVREYIRSLVCIFTLPASLIDSILENLLGTDYVFFAPAIALFLNLVLVALGRLWVQRNNSIEKKL